MAKPKFRKFKNAFGGRKSDFSKLPDLPVVEMIDFESEEEKELKRKLKDERLAKRILELYKIFPNATLPELITYDWLRYNKYWFIYQAEVGPRTSKGSLIPDFVIARGGTGLAWQIQGEYWHKDEMVRARDKAVILALEGQNVAGLRIIDVVELWEGDIYDKRPRVFEEAMRGHGMRS
jgi:hypothetical protein